MTSSNPTRITRTWQAGETGCGSLLIGLKREIGQIGPGELLKVTAFDAGARADIPAWCRLTGHTLIEADHPVYVLRSKYR